MCCDSADIISVSLEDIAAELHVFISKEKIITETVTWLDIL